MNKVTFKDEALPPYGKEVLVLFDRFPHPTRRWYILTWRGDEHDVKHLVAWMELPPTDIQP